MKKLFITSFVIVLSLTFSAHSQTAVPETQQATEPAPMAVADTVQVPIRASAVFELPEAQPVPTSFDMGTVSNIPASLTKGVTLNGYTRRLKIEDRSIGQILITSVALGDHEEPLGTFGLTAQFNAEKNSLFPEDEFRVEGNRAALVAALERLHANGDAEEAKEVITTESDSTPTDVSNGSPGSNEAAYKVATADIQPVEPEPEPVITVQVSTEGCPVRIDTVQEKAIVQSKAQTLTDGALTSEDECTDSEVSYPLKMSYLTCPDVVDTEALTAWPQYLFYYIDGGAENHTVSEECIKDTETPYTISEDESGCSVFLDFNAEQAIPQSALIYTNRTGQEVQARGCDTSTQSEAIAMVENADHCTMRHDLAANVSYELSSWSYLREGITYLGAACADNERTFAHVAVYTGSDGQYICTPIVNFTDNTVTLQSRRQITVDGTHEYINECTPDADSQSIVTTTDGCMDPSNWTHDIAANVSYGQERYYYLKADGTRFYVNTCQTSEAVYTHDQTITGYQYHDDELYAFPLMKVAISVEGQPYTIEESAVLAGASQLVYLTEGTETRLDGSVTYEGCDAYYTTVQLELWERPDGTTFEKAVGVGTPEGPTDICASALVSTKLIPNTAKHASRSRLTGANSFTVCSGQAEKHEVRNMETAEVVSTSYNYVNDNYCNTPSTRTDHNCWQWANHLPNCGPAVISGGTVAGCSCVVLPEPTPW